MNRMFYRNQLDVVKTVATETGVVNTTELFGKYGWSSLSVSDEVKNLFASDNSKYDMDQLIEEHGIVVITEHMIIATDPGHSTTDCKVTLEASATPASDMQIALEWADLSARAKTKYSDKELAVTVSQYEFIPRVDTELEADSLLANIEWLTIDPCGEVQIKKAMDARIFNMTPERYNMEYSIIRSLISKEELEKITESAGCTTLYFIKISVRDETENGVETRVVMDRHEPINIDDLLRFWDETKIMEGNTADVSATRIKVTLH